MKCRKHVVAFLYTMVSFSCCLKNSDIIEYYSVIDNVSYNMRFTRKLLYREFFNYFINLRFQCNLLKSFISQHCQKSLTKRWILSDSYVYSRAFLNIKTISFHFLIYEQNVVIQTFQISIAIRRITPFLSLHDLFSF